MKKGDICTKCGKGTYQEYSVMSDMFGEYKCTHCGDEIKLNVQQDSI